MFGLQSDKENVSIFWLNCLGCIFAAFSVPLYAMITTKNTQDERKEKENNLNMKLINNENNNDNIIESDNIVENEILNEMERILSKGRDIPQIKISDLFELWIGIYFDYAESLIFQGDNRSFEIIKLIYDILEKNKTTNPKREKSFRFFKKFFSNVLTNTINR